MNGESEVSLFLVVIRSENVVFGIDENVLNSYVDIPNYDTHLIIKGIQLRQRSQTIVCP